MAAGVLDLGCHGYSNDNVDCRLLRVVYCSYLSHHDYYNNCLGLFGLKHKDYLDVMLFLLLPDDRHGYNVNIVVNFVEPALRLLL